MAKEDGGHRMKMSSKSGVFLGTLPAYTDFFKEGILPRPLEEDLQEPLRRTNCLTLRHSLHFFATISEPFFYKAGCFHLKHTH